MRTRVGYSGGAKADPTYHDLGDHTETVQLDYDPARVSYEELLAVFWDSHDPADSPWSRQYASIIFYHDEEQKRLAEESLASQQAARKARIYTEIVPFTRFYLAEDYHQKYYLQQEWELIKEFRAMYPDFKDFTDSTAVARVNGYLGGFGYPATLEEDVAALGLSPSATKRLLQLTQLSGGLTCPVPTPAAR